MLSEKPWKSEAILRLFLGVIVCVLMGAAISNIAHLHGGAAKVDPRVIYLLTGGAVLFLGVVLFLVRKPWPLEHFTRYFIGLLSCLYVGVTLGCFAQYFSGNPTVENLTWRTVIAALSFQGAALVLIWRFVREHEVSMGEAFGFSIHWKVAVMWGLLVASVFLVVGLTMEMASAKIMSWLNLKLQEQPAVQALKETRTWSGYLALAVVTIGLAPVAEEMLFRGIFYPGLKRLGHPRLALWGTSLFFAAVHFNVMTIAPLFLLALVLTVLYEKTGNLLAPIAAHSLFNALNFVMFYLQQHFDPSV